MIKAIKALLNNPATPLHGPGEAHDNELQVAAAALLVEAASMDDRFDAEEREHIEAMLKQRFDLSQAETEALLETAHSRIAESSQLFGFTRVVNQGFSAAERVELIEMLWQVVYADGELDDYEANLMRRLAGLVHVSDRDSGEARKRALARLERSG